MLGLVLCLFGTLKRIAVFSTKIIPYLYVDFRKDKKKKEEHLPNHSHWCNPDLVSLEQYWFKKIILPIVL